MRAAKEQEQYEGAVVPIGNSRGMRLPAGFFKSHPEFKGKVRLTVVADGEILVSAKSPARRQSADDEGDPVLAGFLRFLEKQMTERPEDIMEADAGQLRRIGRLVKGVKVY